MGRRKGSKNKSKIIQVTEISKSPEPKKSLKEIVKPKRIRRTKAEMQAYRRELAKVKTEVKHKRRNKSKNTKINLQESTKPIVNIEVKPKRKRRTKAEMILSRATLNPEPVQNILLTEAIPDEVEELEVYDDYVPGGHNNYIIRNPFKNDQDRESFLTLTPEKNSKYVWCYKKDCRIFINMCAFYVGRSCKKKCKEMYQHGIDTKKMYDIKQKIYAPRGGDSTTVDIINDNNEQGVQDEIC